MKAHFLRSAGKVSRQAFTLVEVALAVGVVSFCLVAMVGLMSVGYSGMRGANERAAGARLVEQIAEDIRGASTNSSGAYQALGLCSIIAPWQLGGTTVTTDFPNLSMGGIPTTTDQHMVAHVEITPPASLSATGTALIFVAWPSQAQWNIPSKSWIHAQGSLSLYLIFLPQP